MPKKYGKGKGFLKNTRFKRREQRNVTRRAKKEATRQAKLTEKELNKVTYTFLLEAAKVPAVETYADPLDNVYELPEVEEISNAMADYSTKPTAVKKVIEKEVNEVKKHFSSFKISGRKLLFLLLFSWFATADAAVRWTSLSVAPEDWSFYDIGSIGAGTTAKIIKYFGAPGTPLWLVGEGLSYTSIGLAQAGALQRQVNYATGKYPMTPYSKSLYNASTAEAFLPSSIGTPISYIRYAATHLPKAIEYGLPEKYPFIKRRAKELYNTYYPSGIPSVSQDHQAGVVTAGQVQQQLQSSLPQEQTTMSALPQQTNSPKRNSL